MEDESYLRTQLTRVQRLFAAFVVIMRSRIQPVSASPRPRVSKETGWLLRSLDVGAFHPVVCFLGTSEPFAHEPKLKLRKEHWYSSRLNVPRATPWQLLYVPKGRGIPSACIDIHGRGTWFVLFCHALVKHPRTRHSAFVVHGCVEMSTDVSNATTLKLFSQVYIGALDLQL